MKAWTDSVADAIRAVKADDIGPRLQRGSSSIAHGSR